MIQPNELRIGNWVNYRRYGNRPPEIKQVNSIDHYHIGFNKHHNEGCTIHSCEGIPLTIDTLQRAGFETHSYVGTGDFNVWGSKMIKAGDYNYKITVFASDWSSWHIKQENNPNTPFCKETQLTIKAMSYLHELQNWWRLHTGVELPINLKELQQA